MKIHDFPLIFDENRRRRTALDKNGGPKSVGMVFNSTSLGEQRTKADADFAPRKRGCIFNLGGHGERAVYDWPRNVRDPARVAAEPPVTESVTALTVTISGSRYRKHANFGC